VDLLGEEIVPYGFLDRTKYPADRLNPWLPDVDNYINHPDGYPLTSELL